MRDDYSSLLKPRLEFWSFLNSPFTLAIGGFLVASVTLGFGAHQQCVKDANELTARYKKTMHEVVRRTALNAVAIDKAKTVEELTKSLRAVEEGSLDFKGLSMTEVVNTASDADAQIDWSALQEYYEALFPFPIPFADAVEHQILVLGVVLKTLKPTDLPEARRYATAASAAMGMDAMMRAYAKYKHACTAETSVRHALGYKPMLVQADPGIDKKEVFDFSSPPK